VEDAEIVRTRRARVGLGALGHDVIHQLGQAHDLLARRSPLGLEIHAPVRSASHALVHALTPTTASLRRKSADGDRPFPCSFCGVSSPHLFLRKPHGV
jgi:hypothetical protein